MRRSPRIATKTTTIDFSRTTQHVQYWSAHTLAPNSTRHGLLAENQPETGHHDRQRGQDNRSRPSIDLNRTHRGKRPPCLAPHPPMKKVWLAGEGSVNKSTTHPSVLRSSFHWGRKTRWVCTSHLDTFRGNTFFCASIVASRVNRNDMVGSSNTQGYDTLTPVHMSVWYISYRDMDRLKKLLFSVAVLCGC